MRPKLAVKMLSKPPMLLLEATPHAYRVPAVSPEKVTLISADVSVGAGRYSIVPGCLHSVDRRVLKRSSTSLGSTVAVRGLDDINTQPFPRFTEDAQR